MEKIVKPDSKIPESVFEEKKISKEPVVHTFTPKETNEMQKDLAVKISELRAKENQKSAVMKQLSADIEALDSSIGALADKVNAGFEMRVMDCVIEYDYRAKVKKVIHPETKVSIRVLDLSSEELQRKFDFDKAKSEKAHAPGAKETSKKS